jgi:hypothetical protein
MRTRFGTTCCKKKNARPLPMMCQIFIHFSQINGFEKEIFSRQRLICNLHVQTKLHLTLGYVHWFDNLFGFRWHFLFLLWNISNIGQKKTNTDKNYLIF